MGPNHEQISWTKKPFPKEIQAILVNDKDKENEVINEEAHPLQ